MKKVLSLLLAFIFFQTQSWALSGGPVYSSDQVQSYIGTYAGVLVPEVVVGQAPLPGGTPVPGTPVPGTPATATTSSAAIGLFSFGQPDVGTATGALLLFVNGTSFNGTITGLIDPGDGSFQAVIDAQSTFVVTVVTTIPPVPPAVLPTTQSQDFPIFAQGSVEAEIQFEDINPLVVSSTAFPARIVGTAAVDVFFDVSADGTPIITTAARFEVDGFKQSDTASGGATFNFGQNFTQAGTSTAVP